MSILDILINYAPAFGQGLLVTLQLCVIIWGGGIVGGTLLGALASRQRWLAHIVQAGSFTLSALPLLVVLFWLHYPAQALLGIVINPFITAAATLTLVNVLTIAELVRVALKDFPNQYVVAAQVCGMRRRTIATQIQLPLLLRQLLPSYLTQQVAMLHATLFASLISVEEIFRVAQRINAQLYQPIEIYTALGLFFLLVCLPLNGLAAWLKARYTRNLSEG